MNTPAASPRRSPSPRPAEAGWRRPDLTITRPRRSFGGIFRTAQDEVDGREIGGVPLQAASDAVVAAVQLGYRVADAQIERGRRLTRELTGAARRAGVRDAAQPFDAGEQLLARTLQLGLEWVEDSLREPRSALRRIASAELDAVAGLLGIRPPAGAAARDSAVEALREAVRALAGDRADKAGREKPAVRREPDDDDGDGDTASSTAPRAAWPVVRHEAGSTRRLVQVVDFDGPPARSGEAFDVVFHHATDRAAASIGARLSAADRTMELVMKTQAKDPDGTWYAAVCDGEGRQLGHVTIKL